MDDQQSDLFFGRNAKLSRLPLSGLDGNYDVSQRLGP